MSLFRKNALTLGIGTLVIALTVLIFYSMFSSKGYADMGFMVVLAAEVVSVAAFVVFNKASMGSTRVMVSAGAYTAISIYLFVSVALCAVFMAYLRDEPAMLLAAEAIALALLLIFLILVLSYGKRLSKTNEAMAKQMAAMGALESAVQLMRDNPRNSQYRRQMAQIFEAIRNSDQSVPTMTDGRMGERIYELRSLLQVPNAPREKVTELTEIILQLVNQRAQEVRQTRKGGI